MTRRIHVIVNPAAGRDEAVLATLNAAFTDDIVWDVSVTLARGDARRFAEEALQRGDVDLIAVYGGDGTVGEAADALIGTSMPLGILPGGTGNALARALRVPLELGNAARLIADEAAHAIVDVDTALVNESSMFIVGGATGVLGQTMESASRAEKDDLGMLAYPIAFMQELLACSPTTYRLTLDGEEVEAVGVSCFVANAGSFHWRGMSLFKQMNLTDGHLDLFVIESSTANSILTAIADASSIKIPGGDVPHWRAKRVRIEADDQDMEFLADGEIRMGLPVEITVQEKSLHVVAPHS